MRGRATHDDMGVAREARPQTLRRSSTLQPYIPGRGALATTAAPVLTQWPPTRDLSAPPVDSRSIAEVCERVANAGDAPTAARLVIETLPHALRIEYLRVSLDAPEVALEVRLAPSGGARTIRPSGSPHVTRPLWLLSSPAQRKIHTAQTFVEAGGERFGWVRIERTAEAFDAEERGCLRIVAIALGQRLATLAALEQVSALSAHMCDSERSRREPVNSGDLRRDADPGAT